MDKTPVELSLLASQALLKETNLTSKLDKIDHVIYANVIPSTTDTLYAGRHLGLKLGFPITTPGYSVNRLCGSGIQAIVDAANLARRGEAHAVLVSGAESMSMIPHLVYGSRFGTKYGPLPTVDMLTDALADKHANVPMGITAENLAEEYKISRAECDKFGMRSQENAFNAQKAGKLAGEIITVALKKGEISKDEGVREKTTLEDMAKLKPSFKKDGTVTPGTASGIVDGAASVLVATEEFCKREGLKPLAEILESTVVGVDPTKMGIGPAPAIKKLLQKSGLSLNNIDLIEINEAFAAQTLACVKDLSIDINKLNIWGGAIAVGHPLGATGVRISLTLARQLKETNGKLGIASACIGGGQGIALLLRNV